jgi:hypothetical protein
MDKGWLDRELTFDELDVDAAQEEAFMSGEEAELDDLPYMKALDPDAAYIEAVAAGDLVHGMPAPARRPAEAGLEPVLAAAMDDRFRLACFSQAYLGYSADDFSEAGYLKAVVENDEAKAGVIKEVIGVDREAEP